MHAMQLPCDDLMLVRVRGTALLRALLRDDTRDAKVNHRTMIPP